MLQNYFLVYKQMLHGPMDGSYSSAGTTNYDTITQETIVSMNANEFLTVTGWW